MNDENLNNVNSQEENSEGTQVQTKENNAKDYSELIKTDKTLQSFVDSKISNATKTAVENALTNARKQWQLEQDTQKSEDEKLAQMNETQKLQYQLKKQQKENEEFRKKLNARDLKDEAFKIATSKDTAFDPEFLNLFDYENMTAENLHDKMNLIKSIQDRIVEKTINEWSKEKPPYNPLEQVTDNSQEAKLRKAMGL